MTRSQLGSVIAFLTLATLAVVGGNLAMLDSRVIGIGGVDHFGTLWTWEQARLAILGDPARLAHNSSLYFPFGMDLARNTGGNILDGLLAAPLGLLGFPLGHNLALLAVLVANGLVAAWTIRTPRAEPEARWLVGMAVAFAPFSLYELVEGRPTQALIAPSFLAVEAVLRIERERGLVGVVRAAGWICISGLFYWYYALFLVMFAAELCVVWMIRPRTRAAGQRLLAALVFAALVVIPLVGAQLWSTVNGTAPGLRSGTSDALLLHSFQPLLGVVVAQVGDTLVGSQRAVSVSLVLAILLAFRERISRLPRTILLVGGLGLSVGPYLYVAGNLLTLPMWNVLNTVLPPLDRLWHPSRALMLLVVLGAYGLASSPRWLRAALVALGIGESINNGLLPLPTWSAKPAAADLCLARGEREGAVIDVPFGASQRVLWSQVVHGRPIAGGMHEGAPEFQPYEAVRLRTDNWFYTALLSDGLGEDIASAFDLTQPKKEMGELGFRYVVLRLDELSTQDERSLTGVQALRRRTRARLQGLLGAPVWEDERSIVWAPWGHPLPCVAGSIAPDTVPAEPVRDRWVKELGRWPTR